MVSVGPSRRTSLRAYLLVLAFLALVMNPAEALAGEVKVSGSTLVYGSTGNEENGIQVQRQGSDYKVTDLNAPLTVGSGCSISSPGVALCGGSGITGISINTGPWNDVAAIDESTVSVPATIQGGSEDDILYGGSGDDTLVGGPGPKTSSLFGTCREDDKDQDDLNGGPGTDVAWYGHYQQPASISLDDNANDGAWAPACGALYEDDNVHSDIENVETGSGNDSIVGASAVNVFWGGYGNDTLDGNGGADTMYGSVGDDVLKGAARPPCQGICEVPRHATLNGGSGLDTADYSTYITNVFVDLTAARAGTSREDDVLVGIENGSTGSGDDTLTGDGEPNTLQSGAGADTVNGGGGDDSVAGQDGNDTLNGEGDGDTVDGGSGDDALGGGAGTDAFSGGDGSDTLQSRDGVAEQVSCGAGADTAVDDSSDDTSADCETSTPRNTSPPQISGLARTGATLTVSDGAWTSTPTSYAYHWQRCDAGGNCTDISGATNQDYAPVAADVGATLRASVTASNEAGSSEPANSQMTPTIVAGDTEPPTVESAAPTGKKVSPRANVTVTFSEAVEASTVDGTTFKLVKKGVGTSLEAVVTVSPDGESAKLDPARNLKRGAAYVATVTTGVEDPAGNALDQDPATTGDQPKTWSFRVRR